MLHFNFLRRLKKFFKRSKGDTIDPDEIFLDAFNLPEFDTNQFEGRIEKPLSRNVITALKATFIVILLILSWKLWILQIVEGDIYASQSENNRLRHSIVFAERGVIYDRNGIELAWNVPSNYEPFAERKYIEKNGFAHVLGYVSYPLKDNLGVYYQEELLGVDGIELSLDRILGGENGLKIIETNALGEVQSESVIRRSSNGENITLSIDVRVQSVLHNLIKNTALRSGFVGGAGAIMDITSGELIALTSYPEYDSEILSRGEPSETIEKFITDNRKPFLNRAISGIYTPGSIVKPYLAIGALHEGVIDAETEILSTGSISIQNPYFPDQTSIFVDWKAHGLVDMVRAIGVSSNVYFYEIGGGFEDQEGLGIKRIGTYVKLFGLGEESGVLLPGEAVGVVPSPKWKEEHFGGDEWRIGDTYNTAIGQYGFQITPLQALRAIAAIANKGTLYRPSIIRLDGKAQNETIKIPKESFDIVHLGMRYSVTNGTAQGLFFKNLEIAAKTGTAEVGKSNAFVHSWVTGFFPYENPKYAFVVLMEQAPKGTLIGSVFVARSLLEWMDENTPEYTRAQ